MSDENENIEAIAEFHEYAVHHAQEATHFTSKVIYRVPTSNKRNLYTEANILFLLAYDKLREAEKA